MFITTEVGELMIRFFHIDGTESTIEGLGLQSGAEHETQDGFFYADNFNETLDGGTIYLSPQEKLSFEPFDIVDILGSNIDTKTLLADTIVESQVSYGSSPKYSYQLNLMSKKKEIERIVLPKVSWTKRSLSQNCLQALQELIDDYAPKRCFYDGITQTYKTIYNLDLTSEQEDLLESIKMPELNLNNPTLAEAIDTILSTINAICTVDDSNYIKILELGKRGSEINLGDGHIYRSETTQSAKDYASELDITIQNASQTELTGLENKTRICEYISWRNSDEALLSTENMRIESEKPLYSILSLKICGPVFCRLDLDGGSVTINENVYAEIDIINGTYTWYDSKSGQTLSQTISHCIEEKSIYDALEVEEKKRCVYWKRGENKIEGWTKVYTTSSIWNFSVLENMFDYLGDLEANTMLAYKYGLAVFDSIYPGRATIPNPAFNTFHINKPINLDQWYFKLEYLTESNTRASVGKHLPEKHQSIALVDNQQYPYAEINQLGKLEYQKINRLGNPTMIIYGDYDSESQMPKLGDTIGDFVLIRREMMIYDNHIEFKGILTEHNVNLNYFTGIAARRRSWQVVSASEAFKKELYKKYYCELSFSSKIDTPNDDTSNYFSCEENGFARSLLFRLKSNWGTIPSATPVRSVIVGVNDTPSLSYYQLGLSKYIVGNSIIFTFAFNDNFTVGNYITSTDGLSGGYLQNFYRYTTDEALQTLFYVNLMREIDAADGDFEWLPDRTVLPTSTPEKDRADAQALKAQIKPLVESVDNTQNLFGTSIYNHKDIREIIGLNLQFEFCADTNDIIFGDKFISTQHMISTINSFYNQIKVYASTTNVYRQGDNVAVGSVISGITVNIGNGNTSSLITTSGWNDTNYATYRSYAIADNDGNILVAINKPLNSLTRKTFYLNVIRTRDRNIYTDNGMKTWVNNVPLPQIFDLTFGGYESSRAGEGVFEFSLPDGSYLTLDAINFPAGTEAPDYRVYDIEVRDIFYDYVMTSEAAEAVQMRNDFTLTKVFTGSTYKIRFTKKTTGYFGCYLRDSYYIGLAENPTITFTAIQEGQ